MSSAILSPLLTGSSTSSSVGSDQVQSPNSTLTASDFISLLITQLQNQDPTQPMSNTDLLTQLSQIGQLESNDTMQTTLQGITLQTTIGSAGNLIGKEIQGVDDQNNNVSGVVTGVQVQNQQVYLALDSGDSVQLGNVTQISPAASSSSTGTTSTSTGSTTTGGTTTPTTGTGTTSTGTSSPSTTAAANSAAAVAAMQQLMQ